MKTPYLMLGEIVRPQGVRGEVRVRPCTDDPNRFAALKTIFLCENETYRPVGMRFVRVMHTKTEDAVILRLDGIEDANAAETMRGKTIYVDRAHAVALSPDQDFICDLIGCEVVDDEGKVWGKIADVMQLPANDVYVVRGAMGEILVPALKSVVISSDTDGGRMTVSAARLREVAVFED